MRRIYILHGWTYSTDTWNSLVQVLRDKSYEVVLLNVPGLTAPIDRPWTLDDYVTWLNNSLASESSPVVLMGHSNGGRLAAAFASQYPEKVSHLILEDSAGIPHKDLKTQLRKNVFKIIAKIGKPLRSLPVISKLFYKVVREHDYEKASPIMKETMKNVLAVDVTPQLKDITSPTTIIWGKHDKATPFADAAVFAKFLPHANLEIIDDARHSPHYTHPQQVASIIEKALS